jgi:hypothetical protein
MVLCVATDLKSPSGVRMGRTLTAGTDRTTGDGDIPGALLLRSNPYNRTGVLYEALRDHHGRDGSDIPPGARRPSR